MERLYKRLERGTFRIPSVIEPDATHLLIDRRELELILEGTHHGRKFKSPAG